MSRLEKLRQQKTEQPLVYSRTEKAKEESNFRGPVTVILLLILIGGLVYLLIFSSLFNIKEIQVEGYSNPDKVKQAAAEQVGGGWFSDNILLFNAGAVAEAVKVDPLISQVNIRRILPNKILITVTESKPSLIWSTAGDSYVLDEGGDVIGPLTDKNSTLPIVYDSSGIKVARGDKVASPTFINFIKKIETGFEPATGTKISKITIFDLISDVHILSANGWTVYLDASKDPEAQLANLTKVLKVAQASNPKLEYIDLRLDNKAFYK